MSEDRKIHLMNTVLRWSIYTIWAMMAFVAYIVGPRLESVLYPIVPEFIVTESWQEDGRYFIRGTLVKDRPECEPKSVAFWTGGGSTDPNADFVKIDFSPDKYHPKSEGLRTRPAGAQKWGPWEVYSPDEPIGPVITATSLHQCHFLWKTPSRLAIIKSSDVFPDRLIDQ